MTQNSRQAGMTLVELMIAMTIGLVLIAGAVTMFSQSRSNYRTADNIARLQENARYALDLIEPDVRLAGFWGLNNLAERITNSDGVAASCSGTDIAASTEFAFRRLAIELIDESEDASAILPCTLDAPRSDSDILVIRHASARVMPAEAGQAQVHGDIGTLTLFSNGTEPTGTGDLAETRDVIVSAYYISQNSRLDDGDDAALPAIRRLSLVRGATGPVFEDQEIMPGVENFQVQLGTDTDGDSQIDRWVNTMPVSGEIMAVRLWMLVRAEAGESGQGFVDAATYRRPDGTEIRPAESSDGVAAEYPDSHRRIAITKTVLLRNAQARTI